MNALFHNTRAMIPPVRHAFLFALLFIGISALAQAGSDWQVIKVGNRDYLSTDNIAKFYGLSSSVIDPVAKKIRLENGRNELELRLASREAMINGVRNWLSFPVTEKDGQLLVSRVDLAKTLEPQLRPQMIANLGKVRRLCSILATAVTIKARSAVTDAKRISRSMSRGSFGQCCKRKVSKLS